MPNGIDLATVQNLVNAIIVFVFAVFALITAGGGVVFVALLRQNKRNLELAYQALPPETQTTIRDLLTNIKSVIDVLADISVPDQPPALPPPPPADTGTPDAKTPVTPTVSVENPPKPEG